MRGGARPSERAAPAAVATRNKIKAHNLSAGSNYIIINNILIYIYYVNLFWRYAFLRPNQFNESVSNKKRGEGGRGVMEREREIVTRYRSKFRIVKTRTAPNQSHNKKTKNKKNMTSIFFLL